MTREVSIRELRPGQKVVVDKLPDPEDPSATADVYEQVLIIEPVDEAYRIHMADGDVRIVPGDTTYEVEEETA